MRPEIPRLMIITPSPSSDDGGALVQRLTQALAGAGEWGPQVAIQLRAKEHSTSGKVLHALGASLRRATRDTGSTLLINGRVDIAHAVGADGVHLPEDGLPPAEARRVLGDHALVGVSRHDGAGLALAVQQGADFATLGPFAPTPGKGPALDATGFVAARQHAPSLPVLALGGIGAAMVPKALDAGAAGVAVIRAIQEASDPAGTVGMLLDALQRP